MKKSTLLLLLALSFVVLGRAQSSFNGQMLVNISGTNMKESMDITYYFLNNEVLMVPQIPDKEKGRDTQMGILFKPLENVFYILMDNGKERMAMKKDYQKVAEIMDTTNVERPKITETNETKTISGYLCRKILAETSTSTMEMWVTKDISFSMGKLMAYSSMGKRARNSSSQEFWSQAYGSSIETIVTNKSDGKVVTILVKDINTQTPDSQKFSLDGYQLMELPQMPSFKSMLPFGKKR